MRYYIRLDDNPRLWSVTARCRTYSCRIFDSFQFSHIIGLVILAVSLAVFSAVSGVSRGVRYLSQGNLILVIALLLFILFTGPTVYVLSAFTETSDTISPI